MKSPHLRQILSILVVALLILSSQAFAQNAATRAFAPALSNDVEVVRTANGVPHIRAKNLRAAGYALAWLQCEDYGSDTGMSVLAASGRLASVVGPSGVESDFVVRRQAARMDSMRYARLPRDVSDVYKGFEEGLNRYIELHPGVFPAAMPSDFNAVDVAKTEMIPPPTRKIRAFLERLGVAPPSASPAAPAPGEGSDDGSNAWALAPNRTKSGRAILLRNPHLQWNAGYYEAHMTVPGVIDFYGDFRIGGPFAVIGGFNKYLGFSTTNNSPDLEEFYALDEDPNAADSFLLNGKSQPLTKTSVTVTVRDGDKQKQETREFLSTPYGPVVYRGGGKVYIVKFAGDGEVRGGEQFLRMMRARSLAEWKAAMAMRAKVSSNFTYADRDGNILMFWNASLPLLPHPVGEDLKAVEAKKAADIWTKYVPFGSLPQILNPSGGYVHNENSSPHFSNVRGPINLKNAYPNFEQPSLSLRSQLAIDLIGGDEKFSLEDVVKLKHSYRMKLPERVKPDLIAAVKAAAPSGDVAAALELIEKWDNTSSPESRGSTLFEIWWQNYSGIRPPERTAPLPDAQRYARVWDANDPLKTPTGLADRNRAVESFKWAVEETKRRYRSPDVAWGEVHRVRRGPVDVPVGGCGNDLGCFRILGYSRDKDGKLAASVGDGWVLAVEFADTPRAYSILSYGESKLPTSPYYSDQAEMFARGEMKKVAFTAADVDKQAILRFRPGRIKVQSEK